MKDIALVIIILIAIALSVLVIRFNEKATKAGKNLEEERYGRMVAQESLQKNSSKLVNLENQLKSATDKMAKVQDILDQEKSVNKDLKKQYEKLNKTKADLELKLQEIISQQAVMGDAVNELNSNTQAVMADAIAPTTP